MNENIVIGASGAVGGLFAVLSELLQKDEASAILRISSTVETTLRIPFLPIIAVVLIIVLAVALCFIFETKTKKQAFYVGASVLTIIMTLVPYKTPPSIHSNPTHFSAPLERGNLLFEFLSPTLAYAQEATANRQSSGITLRFETDEGKPLSDVIVTIQDPSNAAIIGRSKYLLDEKKSISFSLYPGNYIIMAESPGFSIVKLQIEVRSDRSEPIIVHLNHSWAPLSFQRLFYSSF